VLLSLPRSVKVLVARREDDRRRNFDGVSLSVRHLFHRERSSESPFACLNEQRDRVKLLL
jgi:hypothetical protein